MSLGTHMPDGERRKPIDIEVCRSRSQLLEIEQKFDNFFVSTQYLKYKKLSTHIPHAERNKIHLDPTFRSYQIFVLFLEVVTLTFALRTSISIGFLLSPPGMCVPSFI